MLDTLLFLENWLRAVVLRGMGDEGDANRDKKGWNGGAKGAGDTGKEATGRERYGTGRLVVGRKRCDCVHWVGRPPEELMSGDIQVSKTRVGI